MEEEKLLGLLSKYFNDREIKEVKKAIFFAKKSHGKIKRASGENFYLHPLRSTSKLARIRMGKDTIIAALLHDILEDTDTISIEVEKRFGKDVLKLIKGVTKLSKVRLKTSWFPFRKVKVEQIPIFERQSETLKKMLLAMAEDVRVIFIKLADKIDNMETLGSLSREKQERIASEVLEIYAPIANRLGMGKWKGTLEDLAFPYVYPEEYKKLQELAIPKIKEREKYLKIVIKELKLMFKGNNIKVLGIDYRAKKWYSLFLKLKKYDMNINKIYDLVAVRIILPDIENCYSALGIIHSKWKPLIGRIKDYIALPKPNGYRSLHTTVFCIDGKITEFQIRTPAMHQQAELGIAAHWIYDEKKVSKNNGNEKIRWLEEFAKIQKDSTSTTTTKDLANTFKLDLFSDRIFVFTPQGDVRDLPLGASAIDFAYSIHTDIGNHCAGAKINGKLQSIKTILKNGDVIEITTNKKTKPSRDWLNFAKTQIARGHIRKYAKRSILRINFRS